jgi:hypothetical protein
MLSDDWGSIVKLAALSQAEFIESASAIVLSSPLSPADEPDIEQVSFNGFILNQSCDLTSQDGKPPRAKQILLVPAILVKDYEALNKMTDKALSSHLKSVWRGQKTGEFVFPHYSAQNHSLRDLLYIDFNNLQTLPIEHIIAITETSPSRKKLSHPLSTKLIQHFASFISRVALPDFPNLQS